MQGKTPGNRVVTKIMPKRLFVKAYEIPRGFA